MANKELVAPNSPSKKDMITDNTSSSSSTPSSIKSRRRNRRRNNKRKSPNKLGTTQTKIIGKGQGNRSHPWSKGRKAPKLSSIMNQQKSELNQSSSLYGDLVMDEMALLEQQMILEAIAKSKKSTSPPQHNEGEHIGQTQENQQEKSMKETTNSLHSVTEEKTSTDSTTKHIDTTTTLTKDTETEQVITEVLNEVVNEDLNTLQVLSDEMLAIHLQKEEKRELTRKVWSFFVLCFFSMDFILNFYGLKFRGKMRTAKKERIL